MGMTATFVTLPNEKLNQLKSNPETVAEFFFIQAQSNSPDSTLDIDKSWHGIHYLLTGAAWGGEEPNCLPIFGGTEFGDEISYGPARYLEPEEVQAAAAVLESTSIASLRERYIPADLEAAEIYPTQIWEDEGDEAFDYLVPWYESLRTFYSQAASRGDAMLLAIM